MSTINRHSCNNIFSGNRRVFGDNEFLKLHEWVSKYIIEIYLADEVTFTYSTSIAFHRSHLEKVFNYIHLEELEKWENIVLEDNTSTKTVCKNLQNMELIVMSDKNIYKIAVEKAVCIEHYSCKCLWCKGCFCMYNEYPFDYYDKTKTKCKYFKKFKTYVIISEYQIFKPIPTQKSIWCRCVCRQRNDGYIRLDK